MTPDAARRVAELVARTYDAFVSDWPGELDFYLDLALEAARTGGEVLEIGCGTGRIAIRLVHAGVGVVGLDVSASMLALARQKSASLDGARWIEGDMRRFDLAEQFPLILIPGHSFQHLLTAEDQLASLVCIQRHLSPSGRLVIHLDHQDVVWLGGLRAPTGGQFEPAGEVEESGTGRLIRRVRAWSFEPATQTAISRTRWEILDADGTKSEALEGPPVRLHCLFRFEMEHLLGRFGMTPEAVYGDFHRGALSDSSSEMIWVVRAAP